MVQTAMDRERAILGQRMELNSPSQTGGMAQGGLQPSAGSPPPMQGGAQQPPGAGAASMGQGQGQPTQGFPELLNQVFQTILQGNEADAVMLGQMLQELKSMYDEHTGQAQGQGQAMPQQGIPSTP